MYTPAGQCIKKDGQCSYYRFPFASSHFSYFPFVESHSTNKLNIIMNHVPGNFIASGNPLVAPYCSVTIYSYALSGSSKISVILSCRYFKHAVLLESFCSFFNDGKCSWYKLIKF